MTRVPSPASPSAKGAGGRPFATASVDLLGHVKARVTHRRDTAGCAHMAATYCEWLHSEIN